MGNALVILLDTHAWVWWLNDSQELSPAANRAIHAARGEGAVYVSSISARELALYWGRSVDPRPGTKGEKGGLQGYDTGDRMREVRE